MSDQELAPLLIEADRAREAATNALSREQRAKRGQFFTPARLAVFMASMFRGPFSSHVRVLDPGAGTGSLTAGLVHRLLSEPVPPQTIEVVAYELDGDLVGYLQATLTACQRVSATQGVSLEFSIAGEDFLEAAVELRGDTQNLLRATRETGQNVGRKFDLAILNPPYAKVTSRSRERVLSQRLGIAAPNLYAAFWGAAIELVRTDGEIVAITPRSFCNGTYFRPFRRFLIEKSALCRLHVFDSRSEAFGEDSVLQENVITHIRPRSPQPSTVFLSVSPAPGDSANARAVRVAEVISNDEERFIRIPVDKKALPAISLLQDLSTNLDSLGLSVSTGPVVDFRKKPHLRTLPDTQTVPLIYPGHLRRGLVLWPQSAVKKPESIVSSAETERDLVPLGHYVLVRRFSAKEEPRRVYAAFFDGELLQTSSVGFENHLNYFHRNGEGLDRFLALGLVVYLNSSPVDAYVRSFSGHTQVNASDLRSLPYPTADDLSAAGKRVDLAMLGSQEDTDAVAHDCFFSSAVAMTAVSAAGS